MLRLDGSGVLPFGGLKLGLDVDYALRPLVLTDAGPGIFQVGQPGPDHNLVQHAVGATVGAAFGLGHRLEIGLAVPMTLFQSGDAVAGAANPSTAGLGNVVLGVKGRFFERRTNRQEIGAGAALLVSAPGAIGTLTHESGFGGEARLFGDARRGRYTVGARAGYRLREHVGFYDIPLGNELTFAAGGAIQLAMRTSVMAELAGVTAAGRPFASAKQSPLEALAGLRQRIGKMWFTLAAGPGLTEGYGSPVFRVVAGFAWANHAPDADGDGISDDDDRCPHDPEDRDGFEDSDGCPDPDNDKDGIPDTTDKCPNEPEDKDGFEDSDGCPDPDNDKDGIPDATDKCPNEPETVNDFEDEDGCPDEKPAGTDRDKDGIPDDVDECPEEPEDKDGFEDEDGCPDPDNDKDGIPDALDKCPLEPETINGIDDEDGCPDKGPTQVRLGKDEIETLKPIYFDTDRSRVRHAFYNILGQIASLLKAHTEIGRCAIEGHTDDTGPPEWNQKLSVLRAESVIEFLASRGGVDRSRLVPIGHGEKLPWASNETPEGRAKNRRVVFHIEGANPAEEKKQEQRQERRRRIRHQRERDEQDRARDDSTHGKSPGAGKPGGEAAAASKPHEKTDGGENAATKKPRPAPLPDAKAPARPADGGKKPPSSVDVQHPPPLTKPSDDDGTEEPSIDSSAANGAKRPPAPSRAPAAKRPPDGGVPTLRELLKLPPR